MSLISRIFNLDKVSLELDDIQAIILRSRPIPYFGTVALFSIESAQSGKNVLKKILPFVTSAKDWHRNEGASVTIAITYQGLKALGVPEESLASFPESFRQGMAARSELLFDVGENDPKHWEKGFKTDKIHVAAAVLASSEEEWKEKYADLKALLDSTEGIDVLFQKDFGASEEVKNVFGFRDGISNPEVEGSGIDMPEQYGKPIKAGEFLLGYPGEAGVIKPFPQPEILGKNGSFLIFRKYQSNVADFNKFVTDQTDTLEEAELLAAKMVGRWKSGAPLPLSPEHDDEELGKNARKNNDFGFKDDPYGRKCPFGSHMRRMNPRDSESAILEDVRLHRIIRKSVSFGDIVPMDVTKNDGKERGQFFMGISADAMGTLEFLQKQWANNGNSQNLGEERDPMIGVQDEGKFSLPTDPIMKKYKGLQTFNIVKGGEYCFLPSLSALKWISEI